jgi:hypothetical protein
MLKYQRNIKGIPNIKVIKGGKPKTENNKTGVANEVNKSFITDQII